MLPTSNAFESTSGGRIGATFKASRPTMREDTDRDTGHTIRILPHYPRRARYKLTPDLIRRQVDSSTLPTAYAAANGMRQRRHSVSDSGPIDELTSTNHRVPETSTGSRFLSASRQQHDYGKNTTDALHDVGNGSTLRIVDECSALLLVSAARSSCHSFTTIRSGNESRVVGRRGNYGGFGDGGKTNAGNTRSTLTIDGQPEDLDGYGLNLSSGCSSTNSMSRRNYMTLAIGTGGSAVHDGGRPTVVTTTAGRSRTNRRKEDYGTSLAVPLPSHRGELSTDDKTTLKNERKSENGGARVQPSAQDELKSNKLQPMTDEESARERRIKKCVGCCKSFIAFLFSTIGLTCLLVGYTILGGVIFRSIECPNEKETKADVSRTTEHHIEWLWNKTAELNVLHPKNWTDLAKEIFDKYTEAVIKAVKDQGWDGNYDDNSTSLQWSFEGALLYSITVITTIGYGHIAPKTPYGQVVTILYAVVGIPLTLLTITNLGGFMATAFRIFYKNVICGVCCCAFCCEPKGKAAAAARRRKRGHGKANSGENGGGGGGAGGTAKKRRKTTGETGSDVGDDGSSCGGRSSSNCQVKVNDGVTPTSTVSYEIILREYMTRRFNDMLNYGGYTVGLKQPNMHGLLTQLFAISHTICLAAVINLIGNNRYILLQAWQSGASESLNYMANINVQFMSGLRRTLRSDDYSNVHVPIYVSFLLMVAYINVGAILFLLIEDDWTYLISCYFCFITLSTVGFGDYVPGSGLKDKSHGKMVLCALYLIVGLSLLAMCFDLMQEEVRRKFRALGTKIGLFDRQN